VYFQEILKLGIPLSLRGFAHGQNVSRRMARLFCVYVVYLTGTHEVDVGLQCSHRVKLYLVCNHPISSINFFTYPIFNISSIVIGSSRDYLLRSRCAITWVS